MGVQERGVREDGYRSHAEERRSYEIGQQVVASLELREVAHTPLERLRNASGETSHLAVLAVPDVVYLEHLTNAVYLDKREEVERYLDVMELLCVASEPPARTVELLTRILDEL